MFTLVVLFVLGAVIGVMLGFLEVTKLTLDPLNRMLRVGFGKHDGKWFARIDLWSIGFRVTKGTK